MLANEDPRVRATREKLAQLKNLGYQYLATDDDGETWTGSRRPGLEIELLMHHRFLGNITITQEM